VLSRRGGVWAGPLLAKAALFAAGARAALRCLRRESKAASGRGGWRLAGSCGAQVVHPVLRQAPVEQGAQALVLGSLEDLLAAAPCAQRKGQT